MEEVQEALEREWLDYVNITGILTVKVPTDLTATAVTFIELAKLVKLVVKLV